MLTMILFVEAMCLSADLAVPTEIYSENSFNLSQSFFQSAIKTRTLIKSSFMASPYIQLGHEMWSKPNMLASESSSSSWVYLAPGFLVPLGALQLSTEFRQKKIYKGANTGLSGQLRLSVVGSREWEKKLKGSVSLFQELYGEGIFEQAGESHFYFSGFSRTGFKLFEAHHLRSDCFVENFVYAETQGVSKRLSPEVRPSLRFRAFSSLMSLGGIVSYAIPVFQEPKRSPGFQFLAFLGGVL